MNGQAAGRAARGADPARGAQAGAPPFCAASGDDLVRVGLVTKGRGLKGEVFVKPLTDDIKRFERLHGVYIESADALHAPDASRAVAGPGQGDIYFTEIERVAYARNMAVVKFAGCDDADAARALKGRYVSITKDQLAPLPQGSYYIFDLVGCAVFDAGGAPRGVLTDVLETGSNDVYVVKRPGGEATGDLLVPAIKSAIMEIDIEHKKIVIDYNEGSDAETP